MKFWMRELAGWLLVLAGLYVLFICFVLLTNATEARLLEAGPLVFVGFIVFRGGIHLLKVAVAARVCLHAQALREQQQAGPRVRTPGVKDARTGRMRPQVERKSA